MLKFAEPHDLGAALPCSTDLAELSKDTGLPVDTLERFAQGEIALSARHRLAILNHAATMCDWLTDDVAPWRHRPMTEEREKEILRARIALMQLTLEVHEERLQERREEAAKDQ